MFQRTLQRLTFNRHAKEQTRCGVSDTLKGGYCENPGTQRTIDGLLCEPHARQFGLEERIACWEAILLHIELWSKAARRRGREDIVRLLQLERAEAAAALERAYKDLKQAENEGYERKKREIYGFMS
jgi:hypothetical protein